RSRHGKYRLTREVRGAALDFFQEGLFDRVWLAIPQGPKLDGLEAFQRKRSQAARERLPGNSHRKSDPVTIEHVGVDDFERTGLHAGRPIHAEPRQALLEVF